MQTHTYTQSEIKLLLERALALGSTMNEGDPRSNRSGSINVEADRRRAVNDLLAGRR